MRKGKGSVLHVSTIRLAIVGPAISLLDMGSWKYLSNLLAGERKQPEQPRLGL
jgi:hypothetical protein